MFKQPLHSWFAQISIYFLEIGNDDDPLKTAILTLDFSPGLADSRRQLTESSALKLRKTVQITFPILLA